MDFSRLDDKRVFVTGAADGIGAALARAFHAAGARVFLCDVAEVRLREMADSLGVTGVACDVRNPTALARVVERAWRDLGGLDLVCANAGVVMQGSILDAAREDLDWIFDINVWGCLNTSRPFVRLLRENERPGHILMTGSEASLSYPPLIHSMALTAYHMTKHAVLALADGLRIELSGEDIGVSVLCPGPVATALSQNSSGLRPSGAAAERAAPTAGLDPAIARELTARSRTPDQIAATAIEGLRRGLFVIPTHPHIADDFALRVRDVEAGFAAVRGSAG